MSEESAPTLPRKPFPVAQRKHKRTTKPVCERLDDRVFLSATPTVTIQDRVLFVVGTDHDDVIDVTIRPFRVAGRQIPVVRVAGVPRWFAGHRFDLVAVNAKDGDDLVRIHDGGRPLLPVWIDGGPGNDTLIGGSGSDTIIGGPGDDVIMSQSPTAVIDAGPGSNIINGIPNFDVPVDVPPPVPEPAKSLPTTTIEHPTAAPSLADEEQAIIDLTNRARAEVGIASLFVNDQLQQAAQIHAENVARLNRLAHDLPETATPTLADRANVVGYQFSMLAENLAFNYNSPSHAVEGWLDSSGHRRNLLDPDLTEIGVAVARNSLGQAYYVQVFGSPMV